MPAVNSIIRKLPDRRWKNRKETILRIQIANEKIRNVFWGCCFKLCLELVCIFFVQKTWFSEQFPFKPDWIACGLSYLYCAGVIFMIPEHFNLSVFACHFFNITSFIPLMVYYWTNSQRHIFPFMAFIMMLLVCICANAGERDFYIKVNAKFIRKVLYILFFIYLVGVGYICVKKGGIDLLALSFKDVWKIRLKKPDFGIVGAYLVHWSAKALGPFFMWYFFYHKKYVLSSLCIIIQVLLYFVFGHRAFLLSIGLMIGLYLLAVLFSRISIWIKLYSGFAFGSLVGLAYGLGLKNQLFYLVGWMGAYRMLLIPAQIKFLYFEYFLNHDKLFFSEGLIGKILGLHYPYDRAIGYVISEYYFGSSMTNANTGIIGDMFSQMGYIGFLVGGILLGLFFWIMNNCSSNIPFAYKVAIASFVCITLNDNPLQTTLLTNGGVVLIILLLLFNSELHCNKNAVK